jgi:hypothetical protein
MSRLVPALLATLALAAGCGGDDDTVLIEDLCPADGEIAGFTEDTGAGAAGLEVADTSLEIEAMIDGDAVPFDEAGFVVFAREFYTDGASYDVQQRVYQMPSAEVAAQLYADLVAERDLYSSNSWTDVAVGQGGRIADTNGTTWWLNAHDGVFYFEVRVNQATASDSVSRGHAEAFAAAVADKIP